MEPAAYLKVLSRLEKEVRRWDLPSVSKIARARRRRPDPFHVLVGTLLSLRTRDEVTLPAARRLLAEAPDPAALAALPESRIRKSIYPVCFYRNKARTLKETSRKILEEFGGRVPESLEELLSLPGVGRKTANLVRILGFGKEDGLCVDTHVHRISNRLGLVETAGPDETEQALRARLPKRVWAGINDLLVPFGQKVCTPLSPWCSKCPVADLCERKGVARSR